MKEIKHHLKIQIYNVFFIPLRNCLHDFINPRHVPIRRKFSDIQPIIAGSRWGTEHQRGWLATGSGTQFGKTVRPLQGAGLLAERCT